MCLFAYLCVCLYDCLMSSWHHFLSRYVIVAIFVSLWLYAPFWSCLYSSFYSLLSFFSHSGDFVSLWMFLSTITILQLCHLFVSLWSCLYVSFALCNLCLCDNHFVVALCLFVVIWNLFVDVWITLQQETLTVTSNWDFGAGASWLLKPPDLCLLGRFSNPPMIRK